MSNYKELQRRPTRDALEQLLAEIAPGGKITRVTRLRGGISCGMHGVNITEKSGARLRVVVRRYNDYWSENDPEVAIREFKTLELLAKSGVPAPRPIWVETDGNIFGTPTIVQTWLSGRADVTPVNMNSWIHRLAQALATLHAVQIEKRDVKFLKNYSGQQRSAINRVHFRERRVNHPDGERVLEALDAAWPRMRYRSIIHTDYWPGNTVWSRGMLVGIVDWEMPRLGEPAYDVAYCRQDLMWLFGQDVADRFRTRYEEISGGKIEHPHFWDLLVATRAMPDPSSWLLGYHDLGRTDITKRTMRSSHKNFIRNALAAI